MENTRRHPLRPGDAGRSSRSRLRTASHLEKQMTVPDFTTELENIKTRLATIEDQLKGQINVADRDPPLNLAPLWRPPTADDYPAAGLGHNFIAACMCNADGHNPNPDCIEGCKGMSGVFPFVPVFVYPSGDGGRGARLAQILFRLTTP